MNNKFSIIIPAHNEERNILKTLTSIVNAINNNNNLYEIIVVDGNSSDNTVEIATKYLKENKIVYNIILNDGIVYPGKARNIGIKNAKYDNLIFIDCGITITKEFISECQQNIENHDILWFDAQFLFDSEIQKAYIRSYFLKKKNMRYIRHFAIKKKAFEKIGHFREDLRAAEDWLFYLQIKEKQLSEYFSEVPGLYGGYPKTFTSFFKKWILYFEHSVYAHLYKRNIQISLIQILFISVTMIFIYYFIHRIILSFLIAFFIYTIVRTYHNFSRSKIKCTSFKGIIFTGIATLLLECSREGIIFTGIATLLLECSRVIGVLKGVIKHHGR